MSSEVPQVGRCAACRPSFWSLVTTPSLGQLLQDPFANHVIQSALTVAKVLYDTVQNSSSVLWRDATLSLCGPPDMFSTLSRDVQDSLSPCLPTRLPACKPPGTACIACTASQY